MTLLRMWESNGCIFNNLIVVAILGMAQKAGIQWLYIYIYIFTDLTVVAMLDEVV